MGSTKLTNYSREQIVADLLRHRFTKACDKLTKDFAALASKVYRDFYNRSALAKIEALPDGWLPNDSDIRAQFSGRVDELNFDGSLYGGLSKYRTSTETVWKPFLAKDKGRVVAVYDATHPLAIIHADLKARQKTLSEDIEAAKKQAFAAVNSVSTVSALIKLWPEVGPFALKHERATAPLPALPTAQLNALLDLPVAA